MLAVADGVGVGVGDVAAVVAFEAVVAGGVGFAEVAFGNAVVAEEDVFVAFF